MGRTQALDFGVERAWYFRIFSYGVTRSGLERIIAPGRPFAFYLHPWEIDPGQRVLLTSQQNGRGRCRRGLPLPALPISHVARRACAASSASSPSVEVLRAVTVLADGELPGSAAA
jgi:hypothetical protein